MVNQINPNINPSTKNTESSLFIINKTIYTMIITMLANNAIN